MSIPDYQVLMLPLLKMHVGKTELGLQDAVASLSKEFDLSEEEVGQLLPSGGQRVFHNRVSWARTYLKMALLLEPTRRGYCRVSERGLDVLAEKPAKIDKRFLMRFPEFADFKTRKNAPGSHSDSTVSDIESEKSPEEMLEESYVVLRENLAAELLKRLIDSTPVFFERTVVEVLINMGYGGTRKDAGRAIGRSGDGGIDGIISQDRLGLDNIFIQAKRWQGTVGRPEIQKFVGALQGQRARKGVFITTSEFSSDACEYAERIDAKVVLIDGKMLANLMIDFNVGVSHAKSFEIKRIDNDFFDETEQ